MAEPEAVRSAVVWCPDWPVFALFGDIDRPCAVVQANKVVACSSAARGHGVRRGLRFREAQRRCPALEVRNRDLAVEARVFESIASVLDALTPRVEIVRPGVALFPTLGPSRYFGGDQAMAERCAGMLSEATVVPGPVRVGVADGAFAASLAARVADDGGVHVVEPGQSAVFLAPLPVRLLDRPQLIGVLERLGLGTLGRFAALARADVVARFGREGEIAHRLASGLDERPPVLTEPEPDMEVAADLDPAVERVDQAAFLGKVLADQLFGRLEDRASTCTRVVITATTESGDELSRQWRHEGSLTPVAVADRVRWQLDGWLSGDHGRRPGSGLVRLAVRPGDLVPAAGRQLGFWGERSESVEQAMRTIARLQGILGPHSVRVPERRGGRSPGDLVVAVPAETVDLQRSSIDARSDRAPWPGGLPGPSPARLHHGLDAEILDDTGSPVRVDARAQLTSLPYQVRIGAGPWMELLAWAGPWPLDERWWDPRRYRRRARMQIVVDDGSAHLLAVEAGQWWVEGTYD